MLKPARIFAVPQADVLSEVDFGFLLGMATSQRKAKAGKFLRREDACRAIVAEALLRYVVGGEAGLAIDDSSLHYNGFGKPFLPGSDLHFNIAHSGQWVVCAIDGKEIGVDVEKHHQVDSGLAKRFFSEAEKALLGEKEGEDYGRMFFKIWSLKESYIKAIGKGLSCPLDSFACLPLPDEAQVGFFALDEGLPQRHFRLVDIHPDYACAVCAQNDGIDPAPVLISPARLIDAFPP